MSIETVPDEFVNRCLLDPSLVQAQADCQLKQDTIMATALSP